MTDGGFDTLVPGGPDDGRGVLTTSGKKKNWFSQTMEDRGKWNAKMDSPSHHTDHTTVHGNVEEEDTKESTWISKDTRWITIVQGIFRPVSVMWSVEKESVLFTMKRQSESSKEDLYISVGVKKD